MGNDKSSDFKSLLEKISKRFQYVCLRSLLFAKMLRFGVRTSTFNFSNRRNGHFFRLSFVSGFIKCMEKLGFVLAYLNMFLVFLVGCLQLVQAFYNLDGENDWFDANVFLWTLSGINLFDGFLYFLEIPCSICAMPSSNNTVHPLPQSTPQSIIVSGPQQPAVFYPHQPMP